MQHNASFILTLLSGYSFIVEVFFAVRD